MNKKIIYILIILILIFNVFSGCLNESNSVENSNISNNIAPIAKIIAPKKAYFEENIEFDASNSNDPDGKIVSYTWDFGDGEITQGVKVNHLYKFENNFFIEYPLIYPVILLIKDNKGTLIATTYQIKLYPKEYKFYLNYNDLAIDKPIFSKHRGNSFIYNLEDPITLNKCKWDVILYLQKPLLAPTKKIIMTLYNSKGEIIVYKNEKLGFNIFWKERIIKLRGEINKEIEFISLKIEIQGILLIPKINLLYGGEKSSYICFNFY